MLITIIKYSISLYSIISYNKYLLLRCPDENPINVQLQEIRPHAFEILAINELKSGDHVLMNYNIDYPGDRGYWYDTIVKTVKFSRKGYTVHGDIVFGRQNTTLNNCKLIFLDDIYKLKPHQLLAERTQDDDNIMQIQPTVTSNNKIVYYLFNITYVVFFS